MAIEDGWILAKTLSDSDTPEQGIAKFVQARRKRVTKTAELAIRNQQIYHMSQPVSGARNMSMKMLGSTLLLSRQDWLYSWKG